MEVVADYGERIGLYDQLTPYLPMALGAGETTLMRLVAGYSVIANGGREVRPSMIDRIQDRTGHAVFRQDDRRCPDCSAREWHGQAEPEVIDDKDYVLDPMTAYQITSMLQGVVDRGTAHSVSVLGVPVAGKTGTTNDEKDVWFVGYTPNLVTGVFMGYDTPRHLGSGETGGGLAAPIFIDFMKTALAGRPAAKFIPPDGLNFHRVDRKSGQEVADGDGISEAFKPGTGPCRGACSVIGDDEQVDIASDPSDLDEATRSELLRNTGGLY
jgi:penicillin-binding protein 1A